MTHKKTAFKMSRKVSAKVLKKFITAIKAKSESVHAVNTVKKQKTVTALFIQSISFTHQQDLAQY